MGAVNVTNTCVGGTQQARIEATDGGSVIVIDDIETNTLDVGPGPHVIVWYRPGTTPENFIPENEWNTRTIDIPVLDCSQAEPTTTEVSTSTAPATTAPPGTSPVPTTAPPTTWASSSQGPETTVAVTGSTLPATGATADMAAPIGAGFAVIGALLVWRIRRRPA